GLSDFDVRNHYAGTALYSLPFKGNRWIEGLQLSTILQYQTGNPVNITESNSTYTGVSGVIRPNLIGPIHTSMVQLPLATTVSFIPATEACTTVTTGCSFLRQSAIGNLQRNAVTGP